MAECEIDGCSASAAVELHVPWEADRLVCPAHARAVASKDGVVARPIEGQEDQWP